MNTRVVAAWLTSIIFGLHPVFSQEQKPTTGSDFKIRSRPEPNGFLLKKGDTLQFRIVGETETESILVVSADGTSLFPYIGSVEVAERTIRDLQEELFRRYDREYFVRPQVQIRVTHHVERRVHLLGAVRYPGPVQIPRQKVPRRFQWYIAEGMLSLPTAKWSMVISFFSGVMASGFAFGCAKDTVEFFNAGIGEVRFPVGEGFLLVIFDYVGPWV